MAQKFIFLTVLWLAVAIFELSATGGGEGGEGGEPVDTTTDEPNTATTSETNTAATDEPNTATGDATTAAPTTELKDPCNPNPCGSGSTCQASVDAKHVCLCLAGDFYNTELKLCERSKAFPGKIGLPNKPYHEDMNDHNSEEFKKTANDITTDLKGIFEKSHPATYSGSVVLELLELTPGTTFESRSNGVTASVQISFLANSDVTETDVTNTINKGCDGCILDGGTFVATNLCDDACDKESTQCKSSDGFFSCTCNEGYMETAYSDRICIACPTGEKLKDNKCVKCSFGYSGFNCSENWKLILVIVGSVLGGLLLIAIILLPVVATQKSSKSFKKNKSAEMEKSYPNLSSASPPMASNRFGQSQVSFNQSANGHSGFQNAPMFPRAATTNSWDNGTNLEMNPSNGRQNFGHMNSGSRIYDEPYTQVRPQSNPYAQSQPRTNPYNQNQGHSNPHYRHDDGRRF